MEPKAKTLTTSEFIDVFKSFSKKDRIKIARVINEEFFNDLWMEHDSVLPNLNLSEKQIIEEIKAVRYAAKKS